MRSGWSRAGFRAFRGLAVAAGCVAAAGAAWAQGGKSTQVPLDRLLKLPSTMPVEASEAERKGNATRQTWLERFAKARQDIEDARAAVAASRAALDEIAAKSGGQWTMSAPGLASAGSSPDQRGEPPATGDRPLDWALSQEIKRNREELERAERRLQELEVEANLAGVPADWRGKPATASTDGRAQPSSGAGQDREGW